MLKSSSQFRITLFDEGTMTLPGYECVIGRLRNPEHTIMKLWKRLSTVDGGEYQGPPELPIVVVDCGVVP